MENQEFVIKGTVPVMLKILKEDFEMSDEEAKFFIYILLERSGGETINTIRKSELDDWYLTKQEDRYKGQIFETHFVINFSTLKKNLYHLVYNFLVKYLFSRGIDLVLIGADLVYLIAKSIERIKDTDYCIYSRIIELCMGSRDKFFDEKSIITANKDGKCDYQEDEWKCTYLLENDTCTCNEEKIRLALNNLEEQEIIKKIGERWLLVQ